MEEIRLGVIGLGRMGAIHSAHARGIDGVRVAAVSDPVPAVLEAAAVRLRCAGEPDWRTLLARDDVDAVLICSPSAFHCEQIVAAARAGKPVFCEKPIDLDLGRIDETLEAVRDAGMILQLGFNRRFDRNFAGLRQRIADGVIGTPWLVRISARDVSPPPETYVRTSGGLFADMTVHDFDIARFLTGDEIVEVSAVGAALVDPGLAAIPDVDVAITTLRFASGALGVIENCRQSAVGWDQRAEVARAAGHAAGRERAGDTVVHADAGGVHRSRIAGFLAERYGGAYLAEIRAFADCVRDGTAPLVSGEDGRRAAIVAAAAQRSMEERRPVATAEIAPGSPS